MEETVARSQPLQTFQVSETKCHRLIAVVERGEHLSKGWLGDMMDVCDPYVVLHVKGIPDGRKETRVISNCTEPEWNERFEFVLDPLKEYALDVSLKDSNYTKDEDLGKCSISSRDLNFNEDINKTLGYNYDGKIHIKLRLEEDVIRDLRLGMDLCDEEKTFVRCRKERVREAMRDVLSGFENGKWEATGDGGEVPIVGVLASGGGYRALIGFAGVLSALSKSGILDCVTYLAGLSGSSWYLAWLFSHEDFPNLRPHELIDQLEERVSEESYKSAMLNIRNHLAIVKKKWELRQPVSVTDMFGHLVGEMILGEKKFDRFSSVREKLKNPARVPMPLCTCLNVKTDVSAREFGEWIEFSPYEFGWTKYGAFAKMEHFGSKFYMGNITKGYDELPLHFLLGCWGNAFSIIPLRVLPGGDSSVFEASGGKRKNSSDEADSGKNEEAEVRSLMPIVEEGSLVWNDRTDQVTEGDLRQRSEDRGNWPRYEKDEDECDSSDDFSFECKVNHATSEKSEKQTHGEGHRDQPSIDHPTREIPKERQHVVRAAGEKDDAMSSDDMRTPNDNSDEEKGEQQDSSYGLFPYMLTKMLGWFGLLNTRDVRAGRVFNPLRGLRVNDTVEDGNDRQLLDFGSRDNTGLFEKGLLEPAEREAREQCLVDSGLSFNLPFPLLMRPQRDVSLYLTFDFSTRTTDLHEPFQEIILAEKWARLNDLPFPPVKKLAQKYCTEPMREMYVFEDPDECSHSPVIIHFIIYNGLFKKFKEPGIKRSTEEEKSFAEFSVFDDPEDNFSMYKFKYSALHFERLAKLMEFNTLLGADEIREQMARAFARTQKRKHQMEMTK